MILIVLVYPYNFFTSFIERSPYILNIFCIKSDGISVCIFYSSLYIN